jgi:hypothetical protein
METKNKLTEQCKPNPDKADFCLLVYFKDKRARSFYNYHTSYSAETKRITIDHKIALNKLIRLLQFKFAGQYKTAIIYYKAEKEQTWEECRNNKAAKQIIKYVDGKLIQESNYTFQAQGFNTTIKIN